MAFRNPSVRFSGFGRCGSTPGWSDQWFRRLLWDMKLERTDDEVRRNRINARVVKRKNVQVQERMT